MSERSLEVLAPGALTTVQDLGRPGYAHLGVTRSGALDRPALRLANRLVGNAEDAAGLETTLDGVGLRAMQSCRIAVTGAEALVTVAGRAIAWGSAVPVPAGAEVVVGPALRGLRSYVAVAGGIEVEAVLGSRSTDLLSGLGPPPLTAGAVLPLGLAGDAPDEGSAVPRVRDAVLHLDLGPRADWFSADALAALEGATYEVGSASNRIGLRLTGAPVERERGGELPTEPMVLGAVQVPPSGQPVVFLADHPTTGGYPVIGVVREADLPVCAQARPGDRLTLRVVGGAAAERDRRPRS
ncbi:biotin-dependent carboxyltransferase family protein [Nocardioides marmorisolisilvae]|uniref:Biotin-dependent carboxyltransferase family protein n=1 Tax=Nocardioides marmorisolisilvae TaxID=1542737 RepID=A0A3N0DVX6_9ACTN|nr:biotin-dependent carboxyltransferase family protein [Nocardioides marmorisolisilvae]RNL79646.1 biotin-dependent carboxyltransferase family protein [Nocardioides marmorisolisilvae]